MPSMSFGNKCLTSSEHGSALVLSRSLQSANLKFWPPLVSIAPHDSFRAFSVFFSFVNPLPRVTDKSLYARSGVVIALVGIAE